MRLVLGADYDSDDEDRLEIATPDDENPIENEKHPFDEMEWFVFVTFLLFLSEKWA